MIPIPFVGAFVGGVVGGFFGEKGSQKIVSILDKKQFISLIKYLKESQVNREHWEFKEKTLDKLGVNSKFFDKSNPRKKKNDEVWLTAICLSLVCFYESRRFMKFNKKKFEQL